MKKHSVRQRRHASVPSFAARLAGTLALGAALPSVGLFALVGATSCGARVQALSTDTGNPPVIDRSSIRITGGDGEVTIIGAPGAVSSDTSGALTVVVTNLDGGATASAEASTDGSFVATVEGTVQDDYEVQVAREGSSSSVRLTVSDADSTADAQVSCLERTGTEPSTGSTTGPQPVCGGLHAEAWCLAEELAAATDRACEVDADCVWAPNAPACVDSCGYQLPTSQAGAAALAVGLEQLETSLCAEFDEKGCQYIASPCPLPPTSLPACRSGQCTAVAVSPGFECSQGVAADAAPTCEQYGAEAECLVEQGTDAVDRSCQTDDDCTLVTDGPSCVNDQCWAVVVSKAGVAALADLVGEVQEQVCGRSDPACARGRAPCSYAPIRCTEGECGW